MYYATRAGSFSLSEKVASAALFRVKIFKIGARAPEWARVNGLGKWTVRPCSSRQHCKNYDNRLSQAAPRLDTSHLESGQQYGRK